MKEQFKYLGWEMKLDGFRTSSQQPIECILGKEDMRMTDDCKYFLHSRDGNSFHFRQKSTPDTDMEGFTLTYVKHNCTVLTGDMGCLCWCRSRDGFDYGFPNKDTGLGYFAEKVHSANNDQVTLVWNAEKAAKDIEEHFDEKSDDADEQEELDRDRIRADEMLGCATWLDGGNSIVGQYQMLKDLEECFPDECDWYKYGFGDTWADHFVYRFEMVKSVSHLVLEAVRVSEEK